ncbi:MBL fold metallo-hydrolase [Persicimonas caeni]|uniref:MBL fold metallo-hydrolase n=1 Tax=Persicimonas caeni TaxID=2292766 RepID=A0A4Y6PVW7_PERCE|nr:MBL fold metallo-hydrolase [Persicimonas caeni]QDG51885.1 MBL fold metallo-hydrolase [Persicimonas caeni]QED33106.1 MBL fold metallo-hydrolase [Persicimonas caeni]
MSSRDIIIESLTVGPIQTNVYVVGCAETGEGVIVDAGGDPEGLLGLADEHDLKITKILQTHAHIDHVAAIPEIKEATGAPIYLHPDDMMLWQAAPQQGQMFGIPVEQLPSPDKELFDGQTIAIGKLSAEVIFLPGHSPGSVGFHIAEHSVILSGDVLFAGSMGRVDLPGSDRNQMRASLERISGLPDDTRVLSGHGPATSIGREKQLNPFLKQDW